MYEAKYRAEMKEQCLELNEFSVRIFLESAWGSKAEVKCAGW